MQEALCLSVTRPVIQPVSQFVCLPARHQSVCPPAISLPLGSLALLPLPQEYKGSTWLTWAILMGQNITMRTMKQTDQMSSDDTDSTIRIDCNKIAVVAELTQMIA